MKPISMPILTIAAALMLGGMAYAQTVDAPAAPVSPDAPAAPQVAPAPPAAPAPIQTAMASDGVTLVDGKWIKDARPATKAEVKTHKRWMAENGQSTTGTPN